MTNSQGWVSLHRKLLDNPIFKNHKLLQTFLYCLLRATHDDIEQLVGDDIVSIKTGQLVTGRKAISRATGLTEQNVRTALSKLEKLQILTINPTSKYSIITVLAWDVHQQTNQQVTNSQPTSNQQVTTNNNINNINNNKTKTPNKFSDDDFKCAEFISSLIKQLNPDQKEPNLNQWADDIRLMRTVDKRDHRDICAVFKFANQDSFWQSNVLSVKTLRKQFDKLSIQKSGASNERRNGHSQQNNQPRPTSAVDRVRAGVEQQRRQDEDSGAMATDDFDVRPQVGVELRGTSGSGQSVAGVLEGDYISAD